MFIRLVIVTYAYIKVDNLLQNKFVRYIQVFKNNDSFF